MLKALNWPLLAGVALRAAGILLRDLVGIAGAVAIVHGLALACEPAAWVAGGVMALAAAVMLSRRHA